MSTCDLGSGRSVSPVNRKSDLGSVITREAVLAAVSSEEAAIARTVRRVTDTARGPRRAPSWPPFFGSGARRRAEQWPAK